MTRAAKALLRAERAYREALAARDPLALAWAKHDLERAHIRVRRQQRGIDR